MVANNTLNAGEQGRYADLVHRPLPPHLVLQFIPGLVAMLTRAEQLKGQPLTRDEVLRLRDNCQAFVCDQASAKAVEQNRGYLDLDPADPWSGWQELCRGKSEEAGSPTGLDNSTP